jgi:hypothetical protein
MAARCRAPRTARPAGARPNKKASDERGFVFLYTYKVLKTLQDVSKTLQDVLSV